MFKNARMQQCNTIIFSTLIYSGSPTKKERHSEVGVLFALVTRWNRTFAVTSTCIFADTLCGEVRIPPTGGILRRAEIYQKIATDLEIRYNTTPHSKFPYKIPSGSMPSGSSFLPLTWINTCTRHGANRLTSREKYDIINSPKIQNLMRN